MEYNWSIEKIRKQKQQTQDLLRKTKDLTKDEKQTLKMIIDTLTDMEHLLLPHRISLHFPQREKYMDCCKILTRDTYLSYEKIPYYLIDTIYKATNYFQDYWDSYDDLILPKLRISNQELVEMSHDFFEWLPNKKYLKYFESYTNPNKHLLRFTHQQNTNLIGENIFFYYPTYKSYFCIDRQNTINDFITLNHEIAHGIMNKNDNTFSINSQHYFLMELEGCFFDFLSIQYLSNFMSQNIIHKLEYDRFITEYDSFISFYVTSLAIKLFQNKKKISIVPLQKQVLKQKLPFYLDEAILVDALQEDPKITAKYLISFLTSLDLEMIYDNDPEYAFYLFEKIRNNKTDRIFDNLKDNNISFMGEKENYISLQKTIQKMNALEKK